MLLHHTYPAKDIVLIWMAEEANFSGCQAVIDRSDRKWEKQRNVCGEGGIQS
jgi:hypothetical protein